MLAVVAPHGVDRNNVLYITVAVQKRKGGRIIASKIFHAADYDDKSVMLAEAMGWAMSHDVKTIDKLEVSKPTYCPCHGNPLVKFKK